MYDVTGVAPGILSDELESVDDFMYDVTLPSFVEGMGLVAYVGNNIIRLAAGNMTERSIMFRWL